MSTAQSSTDEQLRRLFGEASCAAAEQLLAGSYVRDVRLLQGGLVVTGIVAHSSSAANAHRVYIRRAHATRFDGLEGECSCGERAHCAHVVAVALAAMRSSAAVATTTRPTSTAFSVRAAGSGSGQQQALYYLFEGVLGSDGWSDCIQVSLWIGHIPANSGSFDVASLVAFALHAAGPHNELPRYVDARDKEIIGLLAGLRSNGPWTLQGEGGAQVFRQSAATGRAFWRSSSRAPLEAGAPRDVQFLWEVLPNGEQRLRPQAPGNVRVLLSLDPSAYIDADSNTWGPVRTAHPMHLLRTYVHRPPIVPEQVPATNEQIRETGSSAFPLLRALSIRTQSFASLHPRLVLSSGPTATVRFVYNGLDVDNRSLGSSGAARFMSPEPDSDVCWEIARDHGAEQRFLAQLDEHLPSVDQSATAWLEFMMDGVPALQAQGWSICVEDSFPYRIAAPDAWYADINTARKEDWFDLRLGISLDGQSINLLPLLVSYLQSSLSDMGGSCLRIGERLLIRLDDGQHVSVPMERIDRIAHTLVELHEQHSLQDDEALAMPATHAHRIAQLTMELDGAQVRAADGALKTLVQELASFSGIAAVEPPTDFGATLRAYQQEGLGWLQFLRRYRLGGILADDMGLGKTVQTLAHLALEKAAGRLHAPSLIVAPVSVIGNWREELRRFAPALRVLTLHGSRRKELFAAVKDADIVITGYPLLQIDSEFLLSREFYFLILDEAQTIKNPRAHVSQVARALRAQHRLCLTGTPMENHLGELWSLFDFLQPGLLGAEREFQRLYRTPIEKHGDEKRAQALSRRIAPFVLRRTKQAVARELPPKTQIVESLVLEDAQRDFYDGIRLAMHRRVQEVIQTQGLARSHITVLDALLKLRQVCCDPRLVRDDDETRGIPSAKLDWLRTVLPELVAEGRRILLFSQFTSMLQLIEAVVEDLSIPYCLLTGETRQRTEIVQRFQSGAAPLFLISLKAGGVGLNLTAADTVIHYDPWWNPAVEAQATDRAHRIGQDQPVFVYKLIAQGTIEEKIMQLQADKHTLASQLYTQQAAAPSQWSAADIEALFAP